MAEHTQGPWEVGEGSKYAYVHIPESMSATVRIPLDDKAIAYIISAAPELLEALEHLLLDYEHEWGSELVDECYADVRAALAKAKGEA